MGASTSCRMRGSPSRRPRLRASSQLRSRLMATGGLSNASGTNRWRQKLSKRRSTKEAHKRGTKAQKRRGNRNTPKKESSQLRWVTGGFVESERVWDDGDKPTHTSQYRPPPHHPIQHTTLFHLVCPRHPPPTHHHPHPPPPPPHHPPTPPPPHPHPTPTPTPLRWPHMTLTG